MTPLVLVSCDLLKTGGMDRANYALASYVARQGHEVHAVAHAIGAELLNEPNVHFHRVPKPLGSYLLGEAMMKRVGRKVAGQVHGRVLVNGGNCPWPDVNWVHYVHAAFKPGIATGFLRGAKQTVAHRRFLAGERKAIGMARLVIANSQVTKRHLIEKLGVAEEKIGVIYYGIDANLFHPPSPEERRAARANFGWDDRPIVAFVGALGDRRKGFDTLLEAWRIRTASKSWDARLVVMGLGAEVPLWRKRVADLGMANSIEFLGFRRDLPQVLRGCDAMVHPARYEAYGLGVHEALCCGMPAIVSSIAGVAERYPASLSDLLLQDPENSGELAERLLGWRGRHERYARLTFELSEALRQQDWDVMARQIAGMMFPGEFREPMQKTAPSGRPLNNEEAKWETYA